MPDAARKKELKELYKRMKPEMGVVGFTCKATGKTYLAPTNNIKATLNSMRFQLGLGTYLRRALQSDWKQYGEEGFAVETLETLPYDKDDEMKTDYSEELAVLCALWAEKLEHAEEINP